MVCIKTRYSSVQRFALSLPRLIWKKYNFFIVLTFIVVGFTVYHRLDNVSYSGLPKFYPCDPSPYENKLNRFYGESKPAAATVPNIVHFLRFTEENGCLMISKEEEKCIFAGIIIQEPEQVYIHTDDVQTTLKFIRGSDLLKNHDKVITILYRSKPDHIFGLPFSKENVAQHMRDITKLKILRQHGGIFLDNEIYLTRSLKKFLTVEMTLVAEEKDSISKDVIIAHKDARFLYNWVKTYHYYNESIVDHRDNSAMTSMIQSRKGTVNLLHNLFPHTMIYFNSSEFNNAISSLQYYFITLIRTDYFQLNCPL